MVNKTKCLAVVALFLLQGSAWLRAQSEPEWSYVIQRGDNPWSITERLLDGMKYWPLVQRHNGITDPLNIPTGTTLRIPIGWLRKAHGHATALAVSPGGCLLTEGTGAGKVVVGGDKLVSGSLLRSTPGGNCLLQFPDQSRVLLLEESDLRLDRLISYALTGMHDIAARLLRGRVEIRAARAMGPASRFEIHSPQGVTSVRGTGYRLASQDSGARAEVLEGAVDVDNSHGQVSLTANMGTVFTASAAPAPPVRLPPAPDLSSLPASVSDAHPPLPFPAVPGAQAYRQQFSSSPGFETPLSDRRTDSAALVVPPFAEGTYHYRVRAIDSLGLEGQDAFGSLRVEQRLPAPADCTPENGLRLQRQHFVAACAPVPKAQWYRVQVALDEAFSATQYDLLGNEPKLDLTLTKPGRYFWRAAAIAANGREGSFTPSMFVIRAPAVPNPALLELSRSSATFGWRAPEPGLRYHFQLAGDEGFESILVDHITLGDRLVIPRPPKGECFLRLGIVMSESLEPEYGPTQRLNVPPVGPLDWLAPLGLLMLFAL